MHHETSPGRADGEAMPSATSTTKIVIKPVHLDKRGQNYSVSLEAKTLIAKTRNPTADACRRLIALGLSGRLEVWDDERAFPRMIIPDISKAAKLTVAESATQSPRIVPYQPFHSSVFATEAAI
ncbi:hypothetical protein [Rhizobium sp. BG4]|uniref:hypothetical protein n=1 Tax=Rhizobium sp. BG4 TaxID=2613770 RepID=UPI00193D46AF|nr:hypothetical protein [Rhizobium sp. BG4]QRM42812.1 hypothetical protein F2982_04870 [Rhizobium sp. BG4]